MEDIVEILHIKEKEKMMDTLENFYIYKETKMDKQINENGTIKQNILFDTIIRRNSGRGHHMQQTPLCLTLILFSCKPVRRSARQPTAQTELLNTVSQDIHTPTSHTS